MRLFLEGQDILRQLGRNCHVKTLHRQLCENDF